MPHYRALVEVSYYENRYITADTEAEARRLIEDGSYDDDETMESREPTIITLEEV